MYMSFSRKPAFRCGKPDYVDSDPDEVMLSRVNNTPARRVSLIHLGAYREVWDPWCVEIVTLPR